MIYVTDLAMTYFTRYARKDTKIIIKNNEALLGLLMSIDVRWDMVQVISR